MEGISHKKEMVEIQPTGSYFEVDTEGFLINPASLEKIQPEWGEVVHAAVEMYQKQFSEHLVSVYIRGSVAKGEAIQNLSDLDTFSYVDLPDDQISEDWRKPAEHLLEERFPFVCGVELGVESLATAKKSPILLNQSVCVFGEPFPVAKLKPGKAMLNHLNKFEQKMERFDEKLKTIHSAEEVENACSWFMKNTLRVGFELTMEKSGRYTRDLYLCYKDFSEYYPEKESEMREVLYLALNPMGDKSELLRIKNEFVPWLIEESKKVTSD